MWQVTPCYHRSVTDSSTGPVPLRERVVGLRERAFAPVSEVVPGLFRVRMRGGDAYLAVDDRITIIDTGSPGSESQIFSAIESLGRSPSDVEAILVTHYHIDHVGGLPGLQERISAPTGIHDADADAVAAMDPLPNPAGEGLVARVISPYLEYADPGAARVDVRLHDGDELPGLGGIRVVHMPGHTPGSVAFYFPERGAVVVGDAMQFRFGRLMPPHRLFTQDMDEAIGSIRKLARLNFETLCFSHFRPILDGAGERVREFARQLPL